MVRRRQHASDRSDGSRLLREDDLVGPTATSAKYVGLSNLSKSLVLAERVRELVPFDRRGDNWIIKALPTVEAVKTLAEEAANMWPRGVDTVSIFAGSTGGHNALYWGRRFPSGIRRALARTSLYADRIYVINPFVDSFMFHPQRSPLVEPEAWTGTYAANAAFISALHPWIEAGIVELVPNPGMVNFQLGNALKVKAENELVELGSEYQAYMNRHKNAASAESFMYMTDEDRNKVIENMGGLSAAEISELAAEVTRLRDLDPDVASIVKFSRGGTIRSGTGASFPAVQVMVESLSASVISDHAMSIDRVSMSAQKNAAPSQLLSDAFQSLDFSFLNDVPVATAIDVRQKDGLVKFRRYLQDISALSSIAHSGSTYEQRVRVCSDRLADEYQAYKKEWEGLDKKLTKDAFLTIPALAGATAVVTGKIDPVIIGSTCLTGLVKSLFDAWTKRRSQASKPLGVMLKVDANQ